MDGGKHAKRLTVLLIRGIVVLGMVSLAAVMLVIYFLYRPILQQQTMEEAVSTGSILAAQIDVAVQSVVGYSDFYVDSPGLKEALTNYEQHPDGAARAEICQVLAEIQPAGIAEVYNALILQKGEILASSQTLIEEDSRMLNADWNFHIIDGTVSEEFSPFYARSSGETEGNGMLYLRNFTVGEERYTLGLICSTEQIEKDILRLSEGLFSGYAIATMSGPSFYDYGDTANSSAVLEQHANDLTFQDRDSSGYYIADTIPNGSWKVVAYLSNEQFDARFVPVLTASLLMCLLVCVVLILLVLPFSQWLLRPVGVLRNAMERATGGDLDVRVALRPRNEIGQLGMYFNHMLDEIQSARAKERRRERQARQMHYDLLISQINAHYIYNTMSSVNSLARLGRCEDVIRVNSALIRILQNNLHLRDKEIFSTVRREVETVKSYWSIESLRPNNQAEFECRVDEEAEQCPMLKNMLQPLVENSLHHGLLDENTGIITGRIVLTIECVQSDLRICVSDDGKGIAAERLEQLNDPQSAWESDGRHIGIANIRKRLAFVFQEKASMHIRSEQGTQVEIRCPMDRSDWNTDWM